MNVDHDRLLAAIDALEEEGYSVVPTEADADVISAGAKALIVDKAMDKDDLVLAVWNAMIAKAVYGLKNGVTEEDHGTYVIKCDPQPKVIEWTTPVDPKTWDLNDDAKSAIEDVALKVIN